MTLLSTQFNPRLLHDTVFWFPRHLFHFVPEPEFFFPSFWCLFALALIRAPWLTALGSLVASPCSPSVTGKIHTTRIAPCRDFLATDTLLVKASPTPQSRADFFPQLFEIHLPVDSLAQFVTPHSITSPEVPITSAQPSDASLLVRICLSKSVTQIASSTPCKITFSDRKDMKLSNALLLIQRDFQHASGRPKSPSLQLFILLGQF